jgi:magnesium-transporting ATPase (P-type)
MSCPRRKSLLVAIVATVALLALVFWTFHLKNYYDQQSLSGVSASDSYKEAVKSRNDVSNTINTFAMGLFLLAVAPVLRRKDADITLEFSNRPLVWTLIGVIVGAALSVYCHFQFLNEVIESQRLGGTDSIVSQETVPNLFDPAISYWLDLQKYYLFYAVFFYLVCLLWAQPWKRRLTLPDSPPEAAAATPPAVDTPQNQNPTLHGRSKKK